METSYDELDSDVATDHAAQTPSPFLCSRGVFETQGTQMPAQSTLAYPNLAKQQETSDCMTMVRAQGTITMGSANTSDTSNTHDLQHELKCLLKKLEEHIDSTSKLWRHVTDWKQMIEEQREALVGDIIALKARIGATSNKNEKNGTSKPPVPLKISTNLSAPTAIQVAAASVPPARDGDLSVLPSYPDCADAYSQENTCELQSAHNTKNAKEVASIRTQSTPSSDVDKVRATPPQTIEQAPVSPIAEMDITPRSQPDSALCREAPPVPQASAHMRHADIPPPLVRDRVPSATTGVHLPSPSSNKAARWAPWHQDKAKYMPGAYIYINLDISAVGHDAGVLASLLEPDEDNQSRFVPGNRMSESWYAKMQDAKRFGLDMTTTNASPTSGDYKMCVFHRVRLSAGQGEPLVHRRMAFAVLPDLLMKNEVEIVRHQREDGLKDADFVFEYCYVNGAPRLALPNVRDMQERIGVHGRLAPSRARGNQIAEAGHYNPRNDAYDRPNLTNARVRSGPSDLAERSRKIQRR